MPSKRAFVLLSPLIMSRNSPFAYTPYPLTWSAGRSAGFQLRSTLCVNWRSRWSRLGDGTPNRQTHMTAVTTLDQRHIPLGYISSVFATTFKPIPLNTIVLLGGLAAISSQNFSFENLTQESDKIVKTFLWPLSLSQSRKRYLFERELRIPATALLFSIIHLFRSKCLYFI